MRDTDTGMKMVWFSLVLALGWMSGNASGLVIYRLGGISEPPPPEVGRDGVVFIQRNWSDLDAAQGGEAYQLDMDEAAIRVLRHDPQVNIAATVSERGGKLHRKDKYDEAFDGDTSTVWTASRYLCVEFRQRFRCDEYGFPGSFGIDLGGQFFIDRIRIVSGLGAPASIVRNIRMSIGSINLEIRDNREQLRVVQIPPHQRVSSLSMTLAEHNVPWEIAEIEVYAKGLVDQSSYVSDIVDFGAPAAWGEINWSGREDPGAGVFIQTRSGLTDEPNLYWTFTGRGDEKVEVTRSQYNKLRLGEKAGTTYNRDNWTFWSAGYDFADSSGTPVVSAGPRRFLQFKADFVPRDEFGGEVRFLEVRASVPPLASGLVGEIFPGQVEAGEVLRFIYALKPTIQGDDTGFDRLEMKTSSILSSVISVQLDEVEVLFKAEVLEDHRFEISFPRLDKNSSGALFEVEFEAQAFRYGAAFDARVFDSDRPLEVPQGVHAGDATEKFRDNRVAVFTSIERDALLKVDVSPAAFSPNGDGINDRVNISYDLFEITGSGFVTIEIRDLSGRLVRTIHSGEEPIGHYVREWDATDDSGERIPPGVYLYRISVDTDKEEANEVGTVHVVY